MRTKAEWAIISRAVRLLQKETGLCKAAVHLEMTHAANKQQINLLELARRILVQTQDS